MSNHSYAALYYPFIHFKDDRWVKLAALYWDRLGRIVPGSYTPEDSETVRELGDFVETLRPEWVNPNFGETFTKFIQEYNRKLRKRYDVNLRDQWPHVPVEQQPASAGGPSGSDPRLSYVFHEKMTPELRRVMEETRITLPDEVDPRWIGMHPRMMQVYMTALADQLARERGLYPLTDETLDHVAMGGLSVERLAQALLSNVRLVQGKPSSGEVESIAAYVALQTVIPKDISNVSIDTILTFREKYPGERAAFQQYIADFLKTREWLKEIKNTETLNQRLESEYEKELKPKLAELREKLREVNIDTVTGALGIQIDVPSVAAQGAIVLGVVASSIPALAAGAALALIPVLRDHRKAQRELKNSPLAYLMSVEENLRPRKLTSWIRQRAKAFRFFK